MTRAQYRAFSRLKKKMVNPTDLAVVDVTQSGVTFHIAYPGLYVTYDNVGVLLLTETEAEYNARDKVISLGGEMGSDTRGLVKPPPIAPATIAPATDSIDDDDVPF